MSSEKLRLEAELKDNASPGVRKLKKEIEAIRATPGMKAVTGWLGEFKKGADDFVSKGGRAAGTINAMGIGGLTAAASLAEMVKQMKDMGERTLSMRELGREVGLSVDQINAFSHAGAHFGVSGEAMGSALDHLAGQMPEFRRSLGPLMQELGRWPELIKKLQKEDTADQLKDIFSFLGKAEIQREPQLQKKLLAAFFGNGDEMEKLMAQGAKGILEEINKQNKSLGPISPEMLKQAQAFRDAQIGFNDALEKFETGVGPKFLDLMTHIVDDMRLLLGGPTKEEQKALDKKQDDRRQKVMQRQDQAEKRQREGGASDERGNTLDMDDPRIRNALRKKSSFGGDATGLLHQTSFGAGAEYGLVESIAAGTKVGFLAAYRELSTDKDDGGGAGSKPGSGVRRAAYNPDERDEGGGGASSGFGTGWNRSHQSAGGSSSYDTGEGEAPDRFHAGRTFDQKAPEVMSRLMSDLKIGREDAGAILGNLGHESAGFKAFAEGGNGPGRGWAQWTDPGRKRRFFDYASKHHLDPRGDEANYGFLKWELTHTHKAALDALRSAKTPYEKMVAFERIFEGAGVKAYGSRAKYMMRALRDFDSSPDASRKATGLAGAGAETSSPKTSGRIDAHIHVHGNAQKTSVRTSGSVEAKLHRWPTNTQPSDIA